MIGLIDIDSKLPNLALMKISTYYKALGEQVEFVQEGRKYERIYASCIFTWNHRKAEILQDLYGSTIEIGGLGWDVKKTLDPVIERVKPDYELYTPEIIEPKLIGGIKTKEYRHKKALMISKMGIGFTSRGCVRNCGFCFVPSKEGRLRQESEIADIINPKSNVITLYDNNLTADPLCIEKLHEIRDRKLVVNISQGVDIRLMTEDKAWALSEVKHLYSLHYAWDLMKDESSVMEHIRLLLRYVKAWRHMCYILIGYNTSLEEDLYRVKTLDFLGIKPYAMKYNNHQDDPRLNHFAGWVNGCYHKVCSFEEYTPWVKAQQRKQG